jgi:hypothetical protein
MDYLRSCRAVGLCVQLCTLPIPLLAGMMKSTRTGAVQGARRVLAVVLGERALKRAAERCSIVYCVSVSLRALSMLTARPLPRRKDKRQVGLRTTAKMPTTTKRACGPRSCRASARAGKATCSARCVSCTPSTRSADPDDDAALTHPRTDVAGGRAYQRSIRRWSGPCDELDGLSWARSMSGASRARAGWLGRRGSESCVFFCAWRLSLRLRAV